MTSKRGEKHSPHVSVSVRKRDIEEVPSRWDQGVVVPLQCPVPIVEEQAHGDASGVYGSSHGVDVAWEECYGDNDDEHEGFDNHAQSGTSASGQSCPLAG